MSSQKYSRIFASLIISTFVLSSFGMLNPIAVDASNSGNDIIIAQEELELVYHDSTIETIRIVEYNTVADALNAVDSGAADLFGHKINESDYAFVDTLTGVEKQWAYDATSCILTINTNSYPLSNYHLRRAIAYAIDKFDIVEDTMNGQVDIVDFVMPLFSEYSIETEEVGIFYDNDSVNAYHELALAGMLDVDEDGVAEAPNGDEVMFNIWYPEDITGMLETATKISANLLNSGINNTLVPMNYTELQFKIANHSTSYDLALYHEEFLPYGFEYAATNFQSSLDSTFGRNVANLQDSSLNTIASEYTYAKTLEEAEEEGMNALFAIRDLAPVIPIFNYRWLSVYSEHNLEGWVNDTTAGAIDLWNPISITPKSGSSNELVVAVLPSYFDEFFTSLNPFRSELEINQDWLEGNWFNPYLLIYDTPLATRPDGMLVPRQSTSWDMEFLGMVADIGYDQSRALFYCDTVANWTDETGMDAQDYKFTFEYYRNYSLTEHGDMIDEVKVIGDYVAGVTVDDREFYTYRKIASLPILPKHIWSGKDPSTWEPDVEDMVGSGPFKVSSYVANESLTLVRNANYYPEIDTDAPTLRSISILPENPIPAETVVIRVFVEDRSRITNVTLSFTYQIGGINTTGSNLMSRDALGYISSISSEVTATSVAWQIEATDSWGNSAVLATGVYTSDALVTDDIFGTIAMVSIGISAVAIVIVVIIVFFRKRTK
ncbi:MAG: ABC transporter substrate-binding protein [Candidatus Thorarchaeota archaeon]